MIVNNHVLNRPSSRSEGNFSRALVSES